MSWAEKVTRFIRKNIFTKNENGVLIYIHKLTFSEYIYTYIHVHIYLLIMYLYLVKCPALKSIHVIVRWFGNQEVFPKLKMSLED